MALRQDDVGVGLPGTRTQRGRASMFVFTARLAAVAIGPTTEG
jgi:hypothetical protein